MIQRKMWAIGGGKGGIGKSILTISLGIWLAKLNKKVIVVDADLGGADLNILLGIRYPSATLEDFINRKVDRLDDILIDTPLENMKLICGANDMLGIANPKYTQKMRLLRHLNNLSADFILLDLGSGTSYNVLDFFLYASGKIAVFAPQATSLQGVYGFIKSGILRRIQREFHQDETILTLLTRLGSDVKEEKISSIGEMKRIVKQISEEKYIQLCQVIDDFDVRLVTNMVRRDDDIETSKVVQTVSEKYLDIHVTDFGYVKYDPEVEWSVNRMVPFLLDDAQSSAAESTYQIAYKMLEKTGPTSSENEDTHPGSPTTILNHGANSSTMM